MSRKRETKLNLTFEVATVIVFTYRSLRVHCFSFLKDTCSLIKELFKFGLPHIFYLQS